MHKHLRQLDDAGAMIGNHEIGGRPHRRQRVGDHDGTPTGPEKSLVILGIANANHVLRRKVEALERRLETRGFVDPAWQHPSRRLC
jgi:hypothetical protein